MTVAVLAPTVWLCPGGFVPRRRVTMHIEDITDRVREWSKLTRLEFNRKLEEWYNEGDGGSSEKAKVEKEGLTV